MITVTVSLQTNDTGCPLTTLANQLMESVERLSGLQKKNGGSLPANAELAEMERVEGRILKSRITIETHLD